MSDQPFRVRARYAKFGNLRFIGHLDTQRLFERALRRSRLPIRYTQGFSKHIRLNLASALPLGFISFAEMLDFWLNEPVDSLEILTRLQEALPAELRILELFPVSNALPSLQASLLSSDYKITLPEELMLESFQQKLEELISQPEIPITRRNKVVDYKPLIHEHPLLSDDSGMLTLEIRLSSTPQRNARPDDLLVRLGVDPADCVIERIRLNFSIEE
ncbi:MAG: DUF2344 domain-containing protein [Chloroflexi bacterium]|nr:DUF2344 domain-containing protein [Chloroflexota bacterium]